jgi:hypothetical protein
VPLQTAAGRVHTHAAVRRTTGRQLLPIPLVR